MPLLNDPLWRALLMLNAPFLLAVLYVLFHRGGARWTAWRPALWLEDCLSRLLTTGTLSMMFLIALAAYLQGWAIAHRVALVCLLLWYSLGGVLWLTRSSGGRYYGGSFYEDSRGLPFDPQRME